MKCMNLLLVIIGLTIGINSVSSRSLESNDSCLVEEQLLNLKFAKCAPNDFRILVIIDSIVKYRNNTRTSAEFSQHLTEYCQTLQSAVDCSLEHVSQISAACRQDTRLQPLVNVMGIVKKFQRDYCSQTILFEIANDRGFNCLKNLDIADCRPKNIEFAGHPMEDQNVCSSARIASTCINTGFDDCENDGFIKKYANQLVATVIQEFSCA